jgi:hypothetical protein
MKNSRGQNITPTGQITTCCWILTPFTKTEQASYCNKPVGWKMVRDDDGNLVRKYNPICDYHQETAARLSNEEDDDL